MFHFTIGKTKYKIPEFLDIPAGALRKSRKGTDEIDKLFIILEETMGETSKEIKALDTLSARELGEWMKEWTQGATLGEALDSDV